jgi:hypothetical protein
MTFKEVQRASKAQRPSKDSKRFKGAQRGSKDPGGANWEIERDLGTV